jgi:LacI family transcriptional regulator
LGTASRIINGQKSVSDDMRIRVERAIGDLGFKPNALAQSMRRGDTQTIGVVIRDITIPALAEFVKAAQDTLHKAGYTLLVASSEDQPQRELELLTAFSCKRVDGLIMTTASEQDSVLLKARMAMGVPIVMLDREEPPGFDAVLIAHRDGTRRATDYLLDLGHRRIAIITGPTTVRPAIERVRGYKSAFQSRGIAIDKKLIRTADFTADFGYMETCALLSQKQPPTAIIAGGIAMLGGVLRAIHSKHLRIPDDISVVGSSDTELAQLATPPITVVRWSYAEIGRIAAQLLVERLGRSPTRSAQRVLTPTDLVIRASCALLSGRRQ